jgi:hypothetical protein
VVVTIDHTYEAPEVVFPGGWLALQVNPQPPVTTVLTTRIADARFVLSSLATLAAGGNSDADRRRLPLGLARSPYPAKAKIPPWSGSGRT